MTVALPAQQRCAQTISANVLNCVTTANSFHSLKGWFSYKCRYRFDRRCQFKKWSYDWDDYMRTLHKRSLMPAAIGATAIAWIARVLSGPLVEDRGDRSDSRDYMRTSLKGPHSPKMHCASRSPNLNFV